MEKSLEEIGMESIVDSPKSDLKSSKIDLSNLVNNNENKTKDDKIKEILKLTGCQKDVFSKNITFEDVDVENFRQTLKILNSLKFSKFELSKMLSQNNDLLYIESIYVEKCINALVQYFKEVEIVKQVVYMNPYIISKECIENIKVVREVFYDFNIETQDQIYLLEENSNILNLDKHTLVKSLEIIKEYTKNHITFIETIINNPVIIGCVDIDFIIQNMN